MCVTHPFAVTANFNLRPFDSFQDKAVTDVCTSLTAKHIHVRICVSFSVQKLPVSQSTSPSVSCLILQPAAPQFHSLAVTVIHASLLSRFPTHCHSPLILSPTPNTAVCLVNPFTATGQQFDERTLCAQRSVRLCQCKSGKWTIYVLCFWSFAVCSH